MEGWRLFALSVNTPPPYCILHIETRPLVATCYLGTIAHKTARPNSMSVQGPRLSMPSMPHKPFVR